MCRWCEPESTDGSQSPEQAAKQRHVLRLLTLVEHPDALPATDAIRIGQDILALLDELDDMCNDFVTARPGLPRLRGNALAGLPLFG